MNERKTILFTEHSDSNTLEYYKSSNTKRIEKINPSSSITSNLFPILRNFFKDIVLPHGYPESVSSDYFEYQLWDTLQAFCSTITGSFTTRAVLKGVGVGNVEATALSATITWILKDGSGMIGRILFAWCKGMKLDSDCKKWRLFADFLNDSAMAIELFVPYFNRTLEILCLTSTLKSIVGIAGGATRAAITQHQAINNNMAEISAKDGTQETVVNLVASFVSIYLLGIVTEAIVEIPFLFFMMILHLFFNYKAVKSLVFNDLNESRMVLLVHNFYDKNLFMNPSRINKMESVVLGTGVRVKDIFGFDIKLGCSLSKIVDCYNSDEINELFGIFSDEEYVIVTHVEERCIYVSYERNPHPKCVLGSYYHAIYLAVMIRVFHEKLAPLENKRKNLMFPTFRKLANDIKAEKVEFFELLQMSGWNLNSHSFHVDQWNIDWKSYLGKNK